MSQKQQKDTMTDASSVWQASVPSNALHTLPPAIKLETRAVLKA